MTEENYNYRTSQTMLRNQFNGTGKMKMPIIPKFKIKDDDFDNLFLIGFDKINSKNENHFNRMVHFFLYDYHFERVWNKPDNDIEKLSRYKAVLSPDFSMYLEMAPIMQLYNTFRNRWCGAYWASKGIRVIPTVNWGDESTFDFCFDGIEKGSTVAVSTYMASEHDNRQAQKDWFMKGYNEMLKRIEPEKIICYNTPFSEMQGDIVYVDYDLSSWRYMNFESNNKEENLDAFKIGGISTNSYDIINPYIIGKGGGSVYGGMWKPSPNKPYDQRFLGKPGEIKITTLSNGEIYETKIGPDGRAIMERHHSVHYSNGRHSNPHDHKINWNNPNQHPSLEDAENYFDGNVPEFKHYWRNYNMKELIYVPEETMRFETISEFKESILYGAEITFIWNNATYFVERYGRNGKITITPFDKPENEKSYETPNDLLEYMIGSDRLRDIITKVQVIARTI